MAGSVKARDAAAIIKEHKYILERLERMPGKRDLCRESVKDRAYELLERETVKTLESVPIEELNRDRQGIRISALKDAGYETIGSMVYLGIARIAAIYGIGEDTAYRIRNILDDYLSETRRTVRLRLTSDDRNDAATRLVTALAEYMRLDVAAGAAEKLVKDYGDGILNASSDLKAATGGIHRFFSSAATKETARYAYDYLAEVLDGRYGMFSSEIIKRADMHYGITPQSAWEDFSKESIRFIGILEEIVPGIIGKDDDAYGMPGELAEAIRNEEFSDNGLKCRLRRYQEWGVKYILHQGKVLLGDEMGLGKTVQAIAAMVALRNTGATHFIVVCPASVLTNWCREIEEKSMLKAYKVHGGSRDSVIRAWYRNGGAAVTTYEQCGRLNDVRDLKYSMLVVDEAHYVKNPEAKRTGRIRLLSEKAERVLFMTGTALENRVDEMISLVSMLQPDVAERLEGKEFLSQAPQFRKIAAPVYYRRKRDDVLSELPELIETKEWCELLPEEEKIYEDTVLNKHFMEVRRVSWNAPDLKDSSKARRMMEIIGEAAEDGRKVLVFSFFLDTIRKVKELLGDRCYGPVTGSVPPARRQEIIDRFNAAPAGTVLVGQIQSGGTGLNIQSASVVILCEPQFKPSVENQAISRAYRMGQSRNVHVFRLLCENTVDELMTDRLEYKQNVFDAFADRSEAADNGPEIDDKGFADIIEEEIERIRRKKAVS